MHPKSKDRKGNEKIFADARKDRRDAKAGPLVDGLRRSKYGARIAALRAKKAAENQ